MSKNGIDKVKKSVLKYSKIDRLVIFCILMEMNKGIQYKPFSHVSDSYSKCMSLDDPIFLLDVQGKNMFSSWKCRNLGK